MFDPALFDPEEERRRRRLLIPGAEEVGDTGYDEGDEAQVSAQPAPDFRAWRGFAPAGPDTGDNNATAGAYYVGPATRRYQQHLEAMPKQQLPGKLRRILAGLAGASSGYFGGTEAGIGAARDVLNEPYNRSMQRWGVEAGGMKTSADLERQAQVASTAESSQRMRELLAHIRTLEAGRTADAAERAANLRSSPGGLYNVPKGAIEPGTAPPARISPPVTPGQFVPDTAAPGGYRQVGTPTVRPPTPRGSTTEELRQRFFRLNPEEFSRYMGSGKVNVGMGETGGEAFAAQIQAAREIVTRDARYAPFFQESAAAAPGTLGFGAKPAQQARILTQGEIPQDRGSQQLFSEFLTKIEARTSGMGRRARTGGTTTTTRNPNFQPIGVR